MVKSATRTVVAMFGVVAGLAGIEHGIGEILQGNLRPEGVLIKSWQGSTFFRILDGEPAVTIVPNLLLSGLLTAVVSLIFLVWVLRFVQGRHGGLILMGLSAALLLIGGGFGPPVLGMILGISASRIGSPHEWAARRSCPRHMLELAWPWALGGGLAAWLLLMPGTPLLAAAFDLESPTLVSGLFSAAMGLLALSILTGFARDARVPDPAAIPEGQLPPRSDTHV